MKIKKIEWSDVTKPPKLVQDDEWIQGDENVNVLKIAIPSEHNGKTLRILIGKFLSEEAVMYSAIITEDVKIHVDKKQVKRGVWDIFLIIKEDDTTICSGSLRYSISKGYNYTKITENGIVDALVWNNVVDAESGESYEIEIINGVLTTKTSLQKQNLIPVLESENKRFKLSVSSAGALETNLVNTEEKVTVTLIKCDDNGALITEGV